MAALAALKPMSHCWNEAASIARTPTTSERKPFEAKCWTCLLTRLLREDDSERVEEEEEEEEEDDDDEDDDEEEEEDDESEVVEVTWEELES